MNNRYLKILVNLSNSQAKGGTTFYDEPDQAAVTVLFAAGLVRELPNKYGYSWSRTEKGDALVAEMVKLLPLACQ